jgi:hypothetical protein
MIFLTPVINRNLQGKAFGNPLKEVYLGKVWKSLLNCLVYSFLVWKKMHRGKYIIYR